MKKKQEIIGFKLNKVETEQFAVIEDTFSEDEQVSFNYTFSFGADQDAKIIGAFTTFRFLIKDKPFIILKAGCYFSMDSAYWNSLKIEDTNQLKLEKDLLCDLMMSTIGTSRGILHAKTENTFFNKFFIPTLNVKNLINEDMIIV